MTLARERGDPLYQMSVETDDPASLRVSEGAALSIVLVEVSLSARGLKTQMVYSSLTSSCSSYVNVIRVNLNSLIPT